MAVELCVNASNTSGARVVAGVNGGQCGGSRLHCLLILWSALDILRR